MYVGFAILLFSWATYLSSFWSLAGVAVFVLYMNQFQIEPEERALRALFGEVFDRYRESVRRWL